MVYLYERSFITVSREIKISLFFFHCHGVKMKNNIIVMELKLYKISVHFNFICIFNKGFPGPDSKESAFSAGDQGSIPGFGRSPGGKRGNPLQYSCLENPHGQRSLVDYGPWDCKELDRTERTKNSTRDNYKINKS